MAFFSVVSSLFLFLFERQQEVSLDAPFRRGGIRIGFFVFFPASLCVNVSVKLRLLDIQKIPGPIVGKP